MIRSTNLSLKRLSTVAVALALGTAGSSAMALVTQWSYDTEATFVSSTFSGGTTPGTNGTFQSGSELSWGRSDPFCDGPADPTFGTCGFFIFGDAPDNIPDFQNPTSSSAFNRSALTIGNAPGTLTGGGVASGLVNTVTDGSVDAGDFASGINLTHWNNAISGFPTLTGGVIEDTLTLTPVLPVGGLPSVDAPDITFTFRFAETTNSGTCAAGPDGNPTANPCADVFGLFAVDPGDLNLEFDYDGRTYFASVLLDDGQGGGNPIGTLGDQQCAEVNLGAGCQGFVTAEDAATTIQFGFAISTDRIFEEVPAPAPLTLLGLGLLGLGAARRRAGKA